MKTKIDDDIKMCVNYSEYNKISDLTKWGEKLEVFDYTEIES